MTAPVLVLLPGLGADSRLFEPQRGEFPALISPEWLVPRDHESLSSYAARMAEVIRARVARGAEIVLGGVSFGGMLAAEMSGELRPRKLVLIGSALSPDEIAPGMRVAATLGRFVPQAVGARSKKLGRVFIRQLGPMGRKDREFLETMIDAVPFSFLKWAGGAIFGWGGARPSCPVVRVHGDKDRIIPLGSAGVDVVLKNAGHVPSVSHAMEVNEVLRRVMGGARPVSSGHTDAHDERGESRARGRVT